MANIPTNIMKNWQDGDVVRANEYKLERDTIVVAHNDTDAKLVALTTRTGTIEATIISTQSSLTGKTDRNGDHLGTWQGLLPSDLDVGNQALDLAGKQDKAEKNLPNGYAGLDSSGNVPLTQLGNVVTNPLASLMYWVV